MFLQVRWNDDDHDDDGMLPMRIQLYRFLRYDASGSVLLWKIRFVRRCKRLGLRLSIGRTFDAVPTYLGGSLDLYVVKGKCSVRYSIGTPRKCAIDWQKELKCVWLQ